MIKVKIIYDNYSHFVQTGCTERKQYIELRELDNKISLREVAIEIIKNATKSGVDFDKNEFRANKNSNLAIHASNPKLPIKSPFEDEFGLKIKLDTNGKVVFLRGLEPLKSDWTFGEYKEIVDSGYVIGNSSEIFITFPWLQGGAAGPVLDLIGHLADIYGLGLGTYTGIKWLKLKIQTRKPRKIAEQWISENHIKHPRELREFIETKTDWKIAELKLRLGLNEAEAIILLSALGYEVSENSWKPRLTDKGIRCYQKWKKLEEKEYSK